MARSGKRRRGPTPKRRQPPPPAAGRLPVGLPGQIGRRIRRPHLLATAAAAYVLLLLAWGMGTPPFSSPDESAHYVRALGVSGGEIIGERAVLPIPEDPTPEILAVARFADRFTRRVTVPAGLSPAGFECSWADETESAACQHDVVAVPYDRLIVTYVGGYPPLPYVVPAALVRLGDDPPAANQLGRLGSLVSTAALIAVAIVVLGAGAPSRRLTLLGPLAAITPMAVYLGAMLNPNGLEIATALAFAASVFRLARDEDPARWTWVAVAGTGTLLALVRLPTPAWIVFIVLFGVALRGLRPTWELAKRRRTAFWSTAGVLFAAIVANRLWETLVNDPRSVDIGGGGASRETPGFEYSIITRVLSQSVDYIAFGEFARPGWSTGGWWLIVVVLIATALVVGTTRERAVLAGVVATVLLLPPLINILLGGFGVWARYFLPILVPVPVLAAEILARRSHRIPGRLLRPGVSALAIGVAVVQLTTWWVSARRFATGTDGPLWFVPEAEWSPPLGWWPWVLAAVLGTGLLAAAGIGAARVAAAAPRRVAAVPGRPGAMAGARR